LLKIGTTQAQKKLFFKMNQAKNAIKNLMGNDDSKAAADSLDVKESEFLEMDQRMRGEYSLDAEYGGDDGVTLLETLADDRQNQEELLGQLQENRLLQQHVGQALTLLNEKERFVIEQRVSAEHPLTLQEIAEHFSISRERVRQIEEGALKKMKAALTPLIAHAAAA
jgi:RNA polymerase sigma-32 factor